MESAQHANYPEKPGTTIEYVRRPADDIRERGKVGSSAKVYFPGHKIVALPSSRGPFVGFQERMKRNGTKIIE